MKKILVAYDGSEQSAKAYSFALDFADRDNAEIIAIAVAQPMSFQEDIEFESTLESEQEELKNGYGIISEEAKKRNISSRLVLRAGHPADQIISLAEQEKVDMIVMGHRGKSLIKRWLLGSVSKRVLSYAGCTVTIVR